MERFSLPDDLAEEVLARLGVGPPTDLDGAGALYRAWCAQVPFDPVAKAAAVAEGRTPPGADPVEVVDRWLATGLGSTCWGSCAVLAALVERAGGRATVGVDRMLTDEKVDFHSFVVVHDGGRRWALDPVHHMGGPLPIEPGAAGTHPVYRTWFADDDGGGAAAGRLLHHFDHPACDPCPLSYAVLTLRADPADVRAFCEVSARFSGVTAWRFFQRRMPADAFVHARPTDDGTALLVRRWVPGPAGDPVGPDEVALADPHEALAALGYDASALGWLERAGMVGKGPDGTHRWLATPPPGRPYGPG